MRETTEGRVLRLVAILCGVALATPLWVGRFLPLADLPQHLAVVSVMRHHGDPDWGFAPLFDVHWTAFTPYWTHYLSTTALSLVAPVEVASRVLLSLYALAFPWAGIVVCRAFGRSPWLGLLAAPLALNTNFYFGFMNFSLAMILLLLLLAAFEGSLAAPSRGRWIGIALGAGLLFFTHAQVLALFVAAAGLLALTRTGLSWRERGMRLGPLLPALLGLMAPWAYIQFIAAREGSGRRYVFGRVGNLGATMRSPLEALRELPDALAGAFQDGSDRWFLVAWAALLAAALGGARRVEARAWMPAALSTVAYFAAPMAIAGQWNIGPRFALTTALLLLPVLRAAGGRARTIGLLAAAVAIGVSLNAARQHAAFDREAGPFDAALEAVPRGARVMPLIFDHRGGVMKAWPYLHIGQYTMVRRGGMVATTLARLPAFPVRLKTPEAFPYVEPFRPDGFDFATMGGPYDTFLLRSPRGAQARLFPPAAVDTVFASGDWVVLRRR